MYYTYEWVCLPVLFWFLSVEQDSRVNLNIESKSFQSFVLPSPIWGWCRVMECRLSACGDLLSRSSSCCETQVE